ncbi:MAG: DUF4258 domain-containing protein [Candidatus Methylomirabilales bacterium]
MSEVLRRVLHLISRGEIKISEHGYEELAADGIRAREVIEGVHQAQLIEEYPDYPKGPCVLVLQQDTDGKPIHVVWGIPLGLHTPAVLVTSYRPDPDRWTDDFMRRK